MGIYSISCKPEHATHAELDKTDDIDYDVLAEFETSEHIRRENEDDNLCDECAKARRHEQEEDEFEQEDE